MGNDKQRKPQKASSSAQAAEFLATRAATGAGGFGGFSGAAPVAPGGFSFGASVASRLAKSGSASSLPQSDDSSVGASSEKWTATGDVQMSTQLDGEIAQCLRHLSKKDALTKLKALQTLKGLIKTKDASDLVVALPSWVYLYQRLCMDSNRNVRTEAAATLGELVSAVGKAIAPHVKSLMGSWWLAQFDPYSDAATAARNAFQICFPGKKQYEALLYCCADLTNHITDVATSNAQQLGDARKDTPEEMEERYERVVSASLLSLGTLLQVVCAGDSGSASGTNVVLPGSSTDPGQSSTKPALTKAQAVAITTIWNKTTDLLSKPGYIKASTGNKSPLIRSASYTFIKEVCSCLRAAGAITASQAVSNLNIVNDATGPQQGGDELEASVKTAAGGTADACSAAEIATAVLGSLSEKDAGNHPGMWAMILLYCRVFPSCWDHISMRKMFLPRLTSFLRQGCYGSAAASLPALLPLISLIPKATLYTSHDVAVQLLDALWQCSLVSATSVANKGNKTACVSAYQECLLWLLTTAAGHAGGGIEVTGSDSIEHYQSQLLQGSLFNDPFKSAVGITAGGQGTTSGREVGVEILVSFVKSTGTATSAASQAVSTLFKAMLGVSITAIVATAVEDADQDDAIFARCQDLIDAMKTVDSTTAEGVAGSVSNVLMHAMQNMGASSGQLPPAASQLLAYLVRTFGPALTAGQSNITAATGTTNTSASTKGLATARSGASTLSLDQLLSSFLQMPAGSPAADAQSHLIVSWLLSSAAPEDDWKATLATITGLKGSDPGSSSFSDDRMSKMLTLLHSLISAAQPSSASQTPQPWTGAMDTLAAALATETALAHAASMIMNVTPGNAGSASDLGDAVSALMNAPVVSLLATLLGSDLVSQGAARSAVQYLASAVCTGTGPSDVHKYQGVPGLVAVRQLDEIAVVALAVTVQVLSQHTKHTLWSAAPRALSDLTSAVMQLSWVSYRQSNRVASYQQHPSSARNSNTNHTGTDDHDEAEQTVDVARIESTVASDHWLPIALHLATMATNTASDKGKPGLLGGLSMGLAKQEDIMLHTFQTLAASIMSHVLEASQTVQSTDAKDHQESAENVRAAWCTGVVQQTVRSLASAKQQHAAEVLIGAIIAAALQRIPDHAQNTVNVRRPTVLLISHLTLAEGAEKLHQACAHVRLSDVLSGGGSSSSGTSSAGEAFAQVLVHVLFNVTERPVKACGDSLQLLIQWSVEDGLEALSTCTQTLLAALQGSSASGNAASMYTPDTVRDATLALCGRIAELSTPASRSFLASICQTQLPQPHSAGSYTLETLSSLFSVIAKAIRNTPGSADGAVLPDLATLYVKHSLQQPPVTLDATPKGVASLRLAVSWFPVPVRSWTPGQKTMSVARNVTEAESQLLGKLLKHQVVRHGALAAAQRNAASQSDLQSHEEAASDLQSEVDQLCAQLQLSAAYYCAAQLQGAEWHTLLSNTRSQLSKATATVKESVTDLVGAVKESAAALMGTTTDSVAGSVAIQMLRQLQRRGVLAKHPVYPELIQDIQDILADLQVSSCLEAAVHAVHIMLDLLQFCGTQRADKLPEGLATLQSKYRAEISEACDQMLQLILSIGIAACLCQIPGPEAADLFTVHVSDEHASVLHTAGAATCTFLDLSVQAGAGGLAVAAYTALSETDKWLATTDTSLHSIDAMLSLGLCAPFDSSRTTESEEGANTSGALESRASNGLAEAAYLSLLYASDTVTCHLVLPMADGNTELPEFEQGTDAVNYLIHAGLHPQLSHAIANKEAYENTTKLLTAWAILLSHLASSSCTSGTDPTAQVRQALTEVPSLMTDFLDLLADVLPLEDYSPSARRSSSATLAAAGSAASGNALLSRFDARKKEAFGAVRDLRQALRQAGLPVGARQETVCRLLFAGLLHVLPASCRTWFSDLRDRGTAICVEGYTSSVVSPALLDVEMQDVQARGEQLKGDSFSVRAIPATREVVAVITVEEGTSMELLVKLPAALPLKPPEVECRKRVGVNETRMRKWLMSIATFLRTNNRGLADAISMWRSNVESEFAGLEPCLICYSVVAATNSALPKLQCHTCSVRFHPGCLYKWFKSSGKSVCPHCQSPW